MDWLTALIGLSIGVLLVHISTGVDGPWYLSIPGFCLGMLLFGLGIMCLL